MKQSMDEFQRVANFVKPEDTDDWEEKIDKILWSPVQNRIFSRVVRILNSERVARLAKANSVHEPILRRTSIDTTAKKFRESLASAHWDWRITQWLHSLLFDYLPQDYLAIYLDILQTLRQKIPQLIDKMVAVQPNVNAKNPSSVAWETLGPLLKKSWDPVGPILNANKPVSNSTKSESLDNQYNAKLIQFLYFSEKITRKSNYDNCTKWFVTEYFIKTTQVDNPIGTSWNGINCNSTYCLIYK